MALTTRFILILALALFEEVIGGSADYNYQPKKDETEVEIIKVEVYEVPWVGDDQNEAEWSVNNGPVGNGGQYYPESGAAPQNFGVPDEVYGPPNPEGASSTTAYPELTTTSQPGNESSSNGPSNSSIEKIAKRPTRPAKLISGVEDQGQYFIYHPTGLLQKVVYATEDDAQNMEFSARLKYENVEPVKGPIYTYDPQTYVFSRLNRK